MRDGHEECVAGGLGDEMVEDGLCSQRGMGTGRSGCSDCVRERRQRRTDLSYSHPVEGGCPAAELIEDDERLGRGGSTGPRGTGKVSFARSLDSPRAIEGRT